MFTGTDKLFAWKSKGFSEGSIKLFAKTNCSFCSKTDFYL